MDVHRSVIHFQEIFATEVKANRIKSQLSPHLMINDSCVPVIQSIASEYLIKTWLLA